MKLYLYIWKFNTIILVHVWTWILNVQSQEMQNDGSQSCRNVLSYAYVVYYMIAQSVNFNALIHMCNLAELLLLWEL